VPHSALVRAYARTWTTIAAAAEVGMSQSAAHTRLMKLAQAEPILAVVHARRGRIAVQ
jgi:hypothetical protein